MKKSELLKKAEPSLNATESLMDKDIREGNFEDANRRYEGLSTALWVLACIELMSVEEADSRSKAAFRRYLDAKYPGQEEAEDG